VCEIVTSYTVVATCRTRGNKFGALNSKDGALEA
jgi:hypothetical protein